MRRSRWWIGLALTVCAAHTRAQQAQYADNAPRFLSTPTPGSPAIDVTGTPALQRRVDLEFDRIPLAAALGLIERQTGLRFVSVGTTVAMGRSVSMSVSHLTVAAALTELLFGSRVDVQLSPDGRTAVLVSKAGSAFVVRKRQQGGGTIGGRVTDAVTKAPLDQVAVRVEGPSLGAVTTADGRYAIRNVSPGTYHVTARRVGYHPFTKALIVATDSTATADFALTAAPTRLNEMVTTAVGNQRRYEVGNTISTINADSIAPTAPITSLTDLISARAPGVQVEESGGLTGSGETIRIRGQSSLLLQGDPIIIVDGVRQDNTPGGTVFSNGAFGSPGTVPSPSRLNDLDFADIATIDVLKGPAASTEYGTDAANGVIVVTTKRGTVGHPRWTTSAEQTSSAIPERFPTHYYSWGHTTDGGHVAVECPLVAYAYGAGYGSSDNTCALDSVTTWNPLNNSYYSIFGTGTRAKYDLSVSGGSDAARYFVTGSVTNETGIVQLPAAFRADAAAVGLPRSLFRPNGEDQRSVRANTTMALGPSADLTVTGAYLSTYQKVPNAQQLYAGVVSGPAVRDSVDLYGYGNGPFESPVYQLGLPTSQNVNRLTGGMTGNWHPAQWLVGHGSVGVDHGSLHNQSALLPQVAALFPFSPSQLAISNTTTDIYSADLRVSATAAITRTLRSVASIGVQLADTRLQGTTAIAKGITATNITLNGATNPSVAQPGNRQATLGGYGEEEVGVADRLFLTGALRVDAGSGFGHAYTTAVYPKASVSWLALNGGSTTIRLRGAFGESGIQPPNGAALQLYAPTLAIANGVPANAITFSNVANPNLRPERSAEYEGGADVELWQNRASVEVTGYSKTTHDALVTTGTGWELGGYPYAENVGQVRNVGAEAAITASVIRGRQLTWDISVNASVNHNKLVTLAPGLPAQNTGAGSATFIRFVPGFPLYGYWGSKLRYADLNHDGIIEPSELTFGDSLSYAGSSSPTQEASLGMHIGLWNSALTVGALADYRGGFRLMNSNAAFTALGSQNDQASNDPKAPLWLQARAVGAIITEVQGLNGYVLPNAFVEKAAFLRVRELSLTYALSHRMARTVRMQTMSVTAAVRNLALWTAYTGLDPEVTSSSGQTVKLQPTSNTYVINQNIREDNLAIPLLRYWVLRVNVGW